MPGLRAIATLVATCLSVAALSAPGFAAAGRATPDWTWPISPGPPVVVRGFDPPELPWEPGHRGVDLLGTESTTVRAAGAGIVTYAGRVAGVGVVTVTHGELRTTYQPVTAAVTAGERVGTGDPIGTLAAAGSHCPPSACLHWGLRRGDTYLDPLRLVEPAGRPRLLPLGESAIGPGTEPAAEADRHPRDRPAAATTGAMPPGRPVSVPASLGALAGVRV